MNDSRYIIQTKTHDGIENTRIINRGRFASLIAQYFKLEEINSLAFNLPLDKENISGKTKKVIAEDLVEMCANHGLLQGLWELCIEERPNVAWNSALEPTESPPTQQPTSDHHPKVMQPRGNNHNLWLVVALLIVGTFVGVGVGWSVWRNGRDTPENALGNGDIFDFEEQNELVNWDIKLDNQLITPERTNEVALTGNYSLKINVDLKSPDIQGGKLKSPIPQIILNTEDFEGKVVIYHVFALPEAPDNLAAQLFAHTNDGNVWEDSTYTHLTPGKWTSLSWAPLLSLSQIGIEIKMDEVFSDNSQPTYTGPVYIDQVEVLQTNLDTMTSRDPASLDANLEPAPFYDFDSETEGITLYGQANKAEPVWITDPNEGNVLAVDVNMSTYTTTVSYDSIAGGICLPDYDTSRVQAVRAYIYAPDGADNLTANVTANGEVSGQSATFFGGSRDIQPGEWNLLYWSTANAQYCLQGEQGQCARVRTDNNGICISVTTDNKDGYEGTLYLDDIGVYRLSE